MANKRKSVSLGAQQSPKKVKRVVESEAEESDEEIFEVEKIMGHSFNDQDVWTLHLLQLLLSSIARPSLFCCGARIYFKILIF